MNLLAVEVAKIRSTRLWIGLWLGGLALTVLTVAVTLAIQGTEAAAESQIPPIETAGDVRDFVATGTAVGVFALVLGATTMTTEHRHRTLSGTFLATPSRWPVVVAKVGAGAVFGLVLGVLGASIPIVGVALAFTLRGDAVPIGASAFAAAAGVGAATAFAGAMGSAVGAALRSQLVAILGVLAGALVVESVVGAVVPRAVKWFPFSGLTSSLAGSTDSDLLSPAPAAGLMVVYLAVAVAVGIAVTRARDVE